jgi:hypothetical protein
VNWRVFRGKDFMHRFYPACEKIVKVDMNKISTEIVSIEVLWFAVCIDSPAIAAVIPEETATKAGEIVELANGLLKTLVSINNDANFQRYPSIAGYLTSLNSDLEAYGHTPDQEISGAKPPTYAKLTVSITESETMKIKKVIQDIRHFYPKYIEFEQDLIAAFYNEIAEKEMEEDPKKRKKKANKK